jgi:hypothetical protein
VLAPTADQRDFPRCSGSKKIRPAVKRSWAFAFSAWLAACSDDATPLDAGAPTDGSAVDAGDGGPIDLGVDGGTSDSGPNDTGADRDAGIGDGNDPDATIDDSGSSDGGEGDGGVSTMRFTGLGLGRKRTSCGLDENAAIVCWGRTDNPPPSGAFQWIDGGDGFMCGLRMDGTLACWVTANAQASPNDPELQPPPGAFMTFVAADVHACALDATGAATCWGSDADAIAPPPNETFVQLAADDDYTCGMTSDDRLVCWGDEPSDAPSGSGFKGFGAGPSAGCVIDAARELSCFGLASAFLMTPPPGPFVEVDVGQFHACARRMDGTIACFGPNGPEIDAPTTGTYSRIEVGEDWSCALGTDETIQCWGSNFYGQIDVP